MGLSGTSQLAGVISGLAKGQQEIRESYADSGDASFILAPYERIKLSGSVTVTKRVITNVLTVGHVVRGVVGETEQFPLTFPIMWSE